ncbi:MULTISPECIES: 8-amino-7-oxononanoate synthase [unclassified Paenibacillus]|uniref:8-amino-7-oxononanoate synthase n=1 Tax=unclassified Paenibacillus TaxID=185978 RepID=UPI0009A565C4|nr:MULTISPECIES: 8-amino-7-oxononanoate synthase [unclassified Paenibacillus]SLK18934.1 8-amino-7-oxononanoate synthase [Paenibacillus sp. RU5A]SOC75493.1 8-amino-7-oxononanoate synthase [Paenibacillus sp. RU26A]SOC77467.1 8-amino-7-oxononanoate synthase [Paenibacillus sp. RU5M]
MNWMEKELALLADASNERYLRDSAAVPDSPGYTWRGDRVLLNLASNDYLGLARHPAIIDTIREALLTEGGGSGASRLVTGNRPPYGRLEEALATWQHSEAALVFANGYMANSGVIRALVGRGDVVFSDQLNHASIVDGIVLSRTEHARYRHNDMEHLKLLLNKYRDKRRKLIVTDAVFSMDGDQAHLEELVALKQEYGAMLMVDEAHSGGIYGKRGEGLCFKLGLHHDVDVHMGTFSKSFGLYGAYVCGSRTLIRFLVNKARPLIYSTALPPSLVAGISTALTLVQADHWRRERLYSASQLFRSSLSDAGFNVGTGDSPIVPIIVGDNERALRFSEALEAGGIAGIAIRPPTVPDGTARIRFSLSADHTPKELNDASARICKIGLQLGVLSL